MNINHIVIILLIVIILFMTFSPRPKYYTFRKSPYRDCEYGELGCEPDSWAPKHSPRGHHRRHHRGSSWNKEVKHRMRERRHDERSQRRENRRHRHQEPLVEGYSGPGADVIQSSDAFNPSCPPPKTKPQVPTPPGGAGQGPPYLSYDCLGGYCTQVPRATGTYWTSNCDGNCEPEPPPNYPGYQRHNYPPGPPPPPGPLFCPT